MSLIGELKRRNVIRVAVLYLVAGWVLLQVADVLFPALGVPDWGINLILGVLILGFPLVVIFSWVYELTPEGIKREKDVDRSESITGVTGQKINVLIIVLLIVAIGVVALDRLLPTPGVQTAEPSEPTAPSKTEPAESRDQPETAAEPAQVAASRFLNTAPDQSVAVLPFVNMSGDPQNEFFSDGLSEELLNALAGIDGLFVAARTSSFHFKGHTGDVADIARQLRVRNILEGSVRKSGERVRITAQLIDATNGYHLWSETFDRQLNDVFAVQDEISRKVAGALRVTLMSDTDALADRPTENMDAYLAYLRGQQSMHEGGVAGFRQAVVAFEDAVSRDPEFAEAYSGIALAWASQLQWANISRREAAGPIQAAADRAMALAPDLPTALAAHAMAISVSGPDTADDPRVLEALEQAVNRDPDNVEILHWYADALQSAGRPEDAIGPLERALARDPLSADLQMALGGCLVSLERYEAARQRFQSAVELAPEHPRGPDGLATIERKLGRFGEAIKLQQQVIERDPADTFSRLFIVGDYVELGDLERAARWQSVAESMSGPEASIIASRAMLYYLKGDESAAVAGSERAYAKVPAGSTAPMLARHLLYRHYVSEKQFERAVAAFYGESGLPAAPEPGARLTDSDALRTASALYLLRARDGHDAVRRYADSLLTWLGSDAGSGIQQSSADSVRCLVHAALEEAAASAEACRASLMQDQQWMFVFWRVTPELDAVRRTPEWRSLMSEIRASRAEQLKQLRASGEEPEPN